jgi:hypothetical protein
MEFKKGDYIILIQIEQFQRSPRTRGEIVDVYDGPADQSYRILWDDEPIPAWYPRPGIEMRNALDVERTRNVKLMKLLGK